MLILKRMSALFASGQLAPTAYVKKFPSAGMGHLV
jgi:hypothetical protein